ncbi:phospholipase [Parastagonospora nodorum]|nr:phospholipase [Parastagonospora nodorum]KAH4086615.1 phospholipase [Parastagonospora nodorum]KAH4870853.1 phospholipase [Parastagonospora nodorum]KAH5273398.1 phospholipase [Parastagonospora nodorum]
MAHNRRDDDLAYGDYHGQQEGQEGDRGMIGDMGRRLFGGKKENSQQGSSSQGGSMSFFNKLHEPFHGFVSDLKDSLSGKDENKPQQQSAPAQQGAPAQPGQEYHSQHRFMSFAPERRGNETKWYVDGCSYMYAVSIAIEHARESIWILDWWLSPELYLRRPPAKNQQYRLDRLLHAAAERGVKVNIIVYKEVTQALTLSSAHTKHHLEELHPNIGVFRHPDHLPDAAVLQSSFFASMKNMSFSPAKLAQMPGDGLKAIYGAHDGTVIMRSQTHILVTWTALYFQTVDHWEDNKLDRTQSSRMGWSDVALSLAGPVVQDLRTHFSQRWNFIYDAKYSKKATRYARLPDTSSGAQEAGGPSQQREFEGEGERGFGGEGESGESGERGLFGRSGGLRQKLFERANQEYHEHVGHGQGGDYQQHAEHAAQRGGVDCQITRSSAKWSHNINTEHSIQNAYCEIIKNSQHFIYIENQFFITATGDQQKPIRNQIGAAMVERIVRAARNGEKYKMIIMIPSVPAFAGDLKADDALGTRAIMEFQYDSINRGGHSIYEEIARAGVNPMDYIRFYNLRSYDRINSSNVMRQAEQASGVSYNKASEGFDATHDASRDYQAYRPPPTAEYGVYEMDGSTPASRPQEQGKQEDYQRYQQEAAKIGSHQGLGSGRWDSVSECYMLNGEDIRNVPWEGGNVSEMDAFVSEELYIHSKLLIADDQIVICGSANLNDRSQLGDHDSEIAIIIQDPEPIESTMDGRPFRASKFATSLRREIFRKHLGLLKPQDMERPDPNYEPVGIPNIYDWGSNEDRQVADPLSDDFLNLWNWRARTNTEAFAKVFHPVPDDRVKNWKEYDEYYSRFFAQDAKDKNNVKPSLYKWGHVVAENFAQGEQGIREVKEVLSQIKGTLVEMPLLFLKEEDIAKEGVGLNALTEELYT